MLPSVARRAYYRFYHARQRSNGSYRGLSDSFGERSPAKNRSSLGGKRPTAAAGEDRSYLYRPAGPSGGDQRGDHERRREYRAGANPNFFQPKGGQYI